MCAHCWREAEEAGRHTSPPPDEALTEGLLRKAQEQAARPALEEAAYENDEGLSRRRFLTNTALTIGGVMGAGYLGLGLRYLFPNESAATTPLHDVGLVSAFPSMSPTLTTILQDEIQDGVYVVNLSSGSSPSARQLLALDFHCTHLNCPIAWTPGVAGIWHDVCPCHGSQFTIEGAHVAGPAPRPLWRHQVVIHNGRVLVGGVIS